MHITTWNKTCRNLLAEIPVKRGAGVAKNLQAQCSAFSHSNTPPSRQRIYIHHSRKFPHVPSLIPSIHISPFPKETTDLWSLQFAFSIILCKLFSVHFYVQLFIRHGNFEIYPPCYVNQQFIPFIAEYEHPQFVYSKTCHTFGLFLVWAINEESCYEHSRTSLCVDGFF